MWQYFGSQTGFMRTYPAHEWIILPRKPNFPDLYDVRLRPWYVHASSSPKDMIILMDSSGSMHGLGQTMEIMKIAVKTLLTTLGENDFVNIAFFNNTAEWITCFDTLVQANRRTKQILSRGVDELDDGGMAHLGLGLEFAFQAFAKFRENRTEHWAGANCNQIIMLFSDGGTEEAWEVLEKYNYDKSIRIFTYAIGPHPVPYATLKEIACTNRGFFTSIQAMGAVRTKIQDYVKVLGRPLALSSEKNFAWTNFYVDPNGLGMMTTVTLPVFNRTHGENQSIVGVMGVDVALERSMDHEPSYEIGPPGYSFGINRNGYVVFHPDLKTDVCNTDLSFYILYVHASSSPKDMIILMDSSGSMHGLGQTMEIMKIAVKTLLTTLGENDFVNIAFFNNTAEWITCFDTLVQANRRTKQILSRGVDELDDGGMAHLGLGLEFAFQAFAKFRENRTEHWAGANCNQIIMLFSDGGTEEAWEVLEKYNYDKSIRIFTYAIGPHPVPYATLKEIACTNRGFFTSIQAMGAVRTKIQDYVKVLGRPLALSSEKNFAWTNFYVDPNGLGMMTTVTLPVFNRTHGENQSIVGVMGVDVALERSMDHEPSYEIGPPGYSFGINRNGYVVFHPDLKTDTIFTDEPPHLDFMDVEIHSTAKEEVRNAMINMRSSKRALSSLIRMPNGKHIVRHHMEYYYTPVNKTSFSIAVVIPTDRTHFLVVEGKDIQEGLELREDEMRGMYLAPWKYCYKQVMKLNISDLLKNFSDTAATRPEMCRLHLLQRLVWDIQNTEDVMNYWASEELEFKRKGVMATFVQSEGGLTRIYPPSEGHHLSEQINPSRSLFYQRAFYGDDYVFIPPDNGYDYAPNQSDAVITVVKSISFSRSGITYKPAIVGVMVDPLWLQPYLLNTPSGPGKVPVSCGDVDYIICYLIDDGGFIISTNQPDMWNVLGKFLGYADAEIMTELYEKQIYARNEDFNYEDRCKKEVKVSAGFRLSALPFRSTLSAFNIGWLFDLSAWSQLIYWLLSFFAFARIPKSEALPEFYELANETTCNTHEAQYFWGRWGRSYSGNIICNNCTRHYSLAKVGQLNVLLLVTTKPCAPLFCDPVPPPLQAKEEVISPNITNCERLRDVPLRYRKRPDKCYYYSVDENNSECGAVGTLALPHLALIIELISFFIVTKIVHMDYNVPFAAHY